MKKRVQTKHLIDDISNLITSNDCELLMSILYKNRCKDKLKLANDYADKHKLVIGQSVEYDSVLWEIIGFRVKEKRVYPILRTVDNHMNLVDVEIANIQKVKRFRKRKSKVNTNPK